MIEDDELRRTRGHCTLQLLQLSASDERGGIGFLPSLEKFSNDAAAGAGGQFAQLGHGFFRRELVTFFGVDVQVCCRGIARYARAGRDLPGRRLPNPGSYRRIGPFPICRGLRLLVALGCRPREFHSYEKYTLRLVPA